MPLVASLYGQGKRAQSRCISHKREADSPSSKMAGTRSDFNESVPRIRFIQPLISKGMGPSFKVFTGCTPVSHPFVFASSR